MADHWTAADLASGGPDEPGHSPATALPALAPGRLRQCRAYVRERWGMFELLEVWLVAGDPWPGGAPSAERMSRAAPASRRPKGVG